ncbi:hypothetical protein GCM10009609_13900 [Pseudonocardia aurantiaca]
MKYGAVAAVTTVAAATPMGSPTANAATESYGYHCTPGVGPENGELLCTWNAVDADGGIYWRATPDWNTPVVAPGNGFYTGDMISLTCYRYGGPVGPHGNRLWYFAQNASRQVDSASEGWISDHHLDTPGTALSPQPQTAECPPGT